MIGMISVFNLYNSKEYLLFIYFFWVCCDIKFYFLLFLDIFWLFWQSKNPFKTKTISTQLVIFFIFFDSTVCSQYKNIFSNQLLEIYRAICSEYQLASVCKIYTNFIPRCSIAKKKPNQSVLFSFTYSFP